MCLFVWETERDRGLEKRGRANQDSLPEKNYVSVVCIMCKQVCVCVCACVCSAAWDKIHTCCRFFPRHSEICHLHISVALLLSGFQWSFFFPTLHLICFFFNFYSNLFLISAFPTEMCSFSFYNPLTFLISLSSHAVTLLIILSILSLTLTSLVTPSPLLLLFFQPVEFQNNGGCVVRKSCMQQNITEWSSFTLKDI